MTLVRLLSLFKTEKSRILKITKIILKKKIAKNINIISLIIIIKITINFTLIDILLI